MGSALDTILYTNIFVLFFIEILSFYAGTFEIDDGNFLCHLKWGCHYSIQ